MKESVHAFGVGSRLVGVLTHPECTTAHPKVPTLLILNSGLLNRTGPFRLHVILARTMARIGVSCFRMDLSGIGDSRRRDDARPRDEQHLDDIREAVDFLNELGDARTFVVMGICTGADLSHKAILRDPRISGAICIDGYIYPTLRYYTNLYAGKVISLSSWKTLTGRLFSKGQSVAKGPAPLANDAQFDYRWALPPKKQVEKEYAELIKRDVRMLCIFTTSWPCNYERQLSSTFRSLDFGHAIRPAFLGHSTHTFRTFAGRDALLDTITHWLSDPDVTAALMRETLS